MVATSTAVPMSYDEARPMIEDGDLIAVRETKGFLTPFTKFFTHSPITHVGVAFRMEGGLWMAELNSGHNHAVPLSQLSSVGFDVYSPPVADRAAIVRSVSSALRDKINYSFIALLAIGLLDWLRIKVWLHPQHELVCSGYCVKIYEGAGWVAPSRIISPATLAGMLDIKLRVHSVS